MMTAIEKFRRDIRGLRDTFQLLMKERADGTKGTRLPIELCLNNLRRLHQQLEAELKAQDKQMMGDSAPRKKAAKKATKKAASKENRK